MNRPNVSEYHDYFSKYVDLVPDGSILMILEEQIRETVHLFSKLTEEQLLFKYEENKWSMKEVVGHLTDAERMLTHFLFCIARGEDKTYESFDKDGYIQNGFFENQPLVALLEHLIAVRKSTLSLLKTLPSEAWQKQGIALGATITIRALAWIVAGHEQHHLNILEERYFHAVNFPK